MSVHLYRGIQCCNSVFVCNKVKIQTSVYIQSYGQPCCRVCPGGLQVLLGFSSADWPGLWAVLSPPSDLILEGFVLGLLSTSIHFTSYFHTRVCFTISELDCYYTQLDKIVSEHELFDCKVLTSPFKQHFDGGQIYYMREQLET